MKDDDFQSILKLFNLSWKGYRKVRKGVKKRLVRHMQSVGVKSVTEYIDLIGKNPQLHEECRICLTVSISRFFRDTELWSVLEQKILPEVISKNPALVKVWSAGCACGEEVYTFLIVWDRVVASMWKPPRLHVIATDINPEYIERAQRGIYERSSVKEVCGPIKKKYFNRVGSSGLFQVLDSLKRRVEWRVHDLTSGPPGDGFDIIFLRNNLLTYYCDPVKTKALRQIKNSLKNGGILIKGSHEQIPRAIQGLMPTDYHPHVFQKLGGL